VSLPRGILPIGDLVAELLGWAAQGLVVVVDPDVVHDAKQPCLQLRPFAELVKARVGPQHRVLHEILGVAATAGQPPGRAVQHVQQRDGIALEPCGPLRVALISDGFDLGHGPEGTYAGGAESPSSMDGIKG